MATFDFNVAPDSNALAMHFGDDAQHGGFNVDLSQLGLDDDDDVQPTAPATSQLFAHNLIASLQRGQQQRNSANSQMNEVNDVMRLFQPLGSSDVTPKPTPPTNGIHVNPNLTATPALLAAQMDPARATATTKALMALQARSRHPQAADPADPSRGAAVDTALFSSLPADIGSLDCTVYVQYLPVTMKEIEFMDLICAHGSPKRVRICGNPKKEHNWTYGFVEYGSPEEAGAFIAECDGTRAGTFRMRCNIAKTPIVDRLAIDAPPDGKCTFAQKFPNRTLRELILASISVTDDSNGGVIITGGRDGHPHPGASSEAAPRGGRSGGNNAAAVEQPSPEPFHHAVAPWTAPSVALSMLPEVTMQLTAAVKDATRFLSDRNQSHFFSAKGIVQQVLEHAKRRTDTMSPQMQTATLLNGTDTVFICRLVLTALHFLHGSFEDALRYALSALQSVPTPVSIVTYLNSLATAPEARGALPRGLTPLMLNHIVCFGLLVEPVSVVAARAFFHLAQHRASMHGYAPNKALDVVLQSDVVPLSRGGQSLQRALFPLLHTQPGGFPGYFFASLVQNGFTAEQSCASLFAYSLDNNGAADAAAASTVVYVPSSRSAW